MKSAMLSIMVTTQGVTNAMMIPPTGSGSSSRSTAPGRINVMNTASNQLMKNRFSKHPTTFIINDYHSQKFMSTRLLNSKLSPEEIDGNFDTIRPNFGLTVSLPESQYTQVLYTNDLYSVAGKL
jgi:hypothetical protein